MIIWTKQTQNHKKEQSVRKNMTKRPKRNFRDEWKQNYVGLMPRGKSAQSRGLLQHLPSFRGQTNSLSNPSGPSYPLLNPEEEKEVESTTMSYTSDRRRSSPYRRTLGGRGREWASECLKLLEALLELDDSKPVKEPVNPLKYPDYYVHINYPLDLSKIMLKFHGGAYASMEAFSKDMRDMFNNYKIFFKDNDTQIYTQVHRLSWWFEAEFTRIHEKWGKKLYNVEDALKERRVGRPRINRTLNIIPITSGHEPSSSFHQHNQVAQVHVPDIYYDEQTRLLAEDIPARMKRKRSCEEASSSSSVETNTNIILSINHGRCSVSQKQTDNPNDPSHSSRLQDPGPSTTQTDRTRPSILHHRPQSEPNVPPALARLKPGTVAQLLGPRGSFPRSDKAPTAIGLYKTAPHELSQTLPVAQEDTPPPNVQIVPDSASKNHRIPRMNVNMLTLQLNVSNIWFGTARIKPKRLGLLTETGLQLSLNSGDIETPFTIHADEMVRCVAHFGRSSNKHTLFLFVLPSCSKRLEAINTKYTHCSMIVIFLNSRNSVHISTMIHIFWNIGQSSMFGPIFSEVDQQGALLLLGNIKPGIMSRVANRYKSTSIPTALSNASSNLAEVARMESPLKGNKRKRKSPLPLRASEQRDGPSPGPSHDQSVSASNEVITESRQTESPQIDRTVMPDSSISSAQDTELQSTSGNSQQFDRDFAERLGATLQKGFKEGISEVFKNLADTLYNKVLPTAPAERDEMEAESSDQHISNIPQRADDEGSDIEIVIPDSDHEDAAAKLEEPTSDNDIEEDLEVTGEKLSIRCPITQQIMKHPLKNKHCNHCYDRQGVEELIKNRQEKAKCPVAGCSNIIPLDMRDMKYVYELWKYIQEKVNPEVLEPPKSD